MDLAVVSEGKGSKTFIVMGQVCMVETANLDDPAGANVLITFTGGGTKKLVGEAAQHFLRAFGKLLDVGTDL